jgi:hypothetical protein
MTRHNIKIGEFELDKLPKEERGMPEIDITFEIDINGIVTVSALEREVNEKKTIIVNTNKNGLKPQQLQVLIDEALEQEMTDEIDRVKKYSHYEIEDLCANIITNINNKEFKLTQRDLDNTRNDVEIIMAWLKEKSYKDRNIDEYDDALYNMKKKYGVLILHGKLDNNKVKDVSEHIDATTLYNKEDDEEEEEMRQAFEKVKNEELGEGMSDGEKTEIKDMRDSLMELCGTVNNIVGSGKLNMNKEFKKEIVQYINDVMMWYYSHEKPTKIDYKEKIDYVNAICNEIVEKYENEGKELFDRGELDRSTDNNSEKLEKLCLTLTTMIGNKQLYGSKAHFVILERKLQNMLKFIYSRKNISQDDQSNNRVNTSIDQSNDNSINPTSPDALLTSEQKNINPTENHLSTGKPKILKTSENMTDTEFQSKCLEYMIYVNTMCDDMYNKVQGITMRGGPTVTLGKQSIELQQQVITQQIDISRYDDKKNVEIDKDVDCEKHGMSIMELLMMKQNEEIDEMINQQIEPDGCDEINDLDDDLEKEHPDLNLEENKHVDDNQTAVRAKDIRNKLKDKRDLFMS